jgi:hypothetical protein
LASWARELPRDMKANPNVKIRHKFPVLFLKAFIRI